MINRAKTFLIVVGCLFSTAAIADRCGQFDQPCWTSATRAACPATGIGTTGYNETTGQIDICRSDGWESVTVDPASSSTVQASIIRSNNTTTYTANTSWNNGTPTYLTFTNVCRAVGTSVLIPQILILDKANNTLALQGILWLFSVAPTPIADDAAFSIVAADWPNIITSQGFTTGIAVNQTFASGGATIADLNGLQVQAKCAAADRNLYGMVQVVNAYGPIALEELLITLKSVGID